MKGLWLMAKEGGCGFSYLDVLSDEKAMQIQDCTLRILKDTGMKIQDIATLELLAENGATVDLKAQTAKFPEKLVMDTILKTPGEFVLKSRQEENDCIIKSGGAFVSATSPGLNSVDLKTWEPKKPTRKEYYDYMRVVDALEYVDFIGSFPWGGFEGVPECMRLVEGLAAKLRSSTKAVWEGSELDNNVFNNMLVKALGVDLWQNTNPTSPLLLNRSTCELIKYLAENDMVFSITSGPSLGATSPVTLAGSIALNNADILASNAVAQLVKPGTRTIAGGMFMLMNMRTCTPVFSNACTFLAESAFSQVWRRYGIPCASNSPGWSNSKMIDYQAAYETTMGLFSLALSGASVIAYAGGLSAELTGHPVKAIIDNDILGMVKRFMKGIDVNEETLAFSLINEIGFSPNSYLAEEHTLEWFRNESFTPLAADMLPIEKWLNEGKKSIIDHGVERMEDILKNHRPTPLTPSQEADIENILTEARKHYKKQGLISENEWNIYQKTLASENYPYA